jgi:hypothetical protein
MSRYTLKKKEMPFVDNLKTNIITFADPNFEEAVRREINKREGDITFKDAADYQATKLLSLALTNTENNNTRTSLSLHSIYLYGLFAFQKQSWLCHAL